MKQTLSGARSLLLLLTAATGFAQQTVWLPPPGRIVVTPVFVTQSFRDFRMGSQRARLDDSVTQRTGYLSLEAGLSRSLAADFTAGYSQVRSGAFGGPRSDGGMTDALFGVRWRFHKALALRAGGIVRGTYTPNYPFSAGDGGSGVEASLLAGHTFGESGFSLYGDSGYRARSRRVPPDAFGSAGAVKSFRAFSLSGAYRHSRGLSGSDIGDPGFTFPGLREIHHTLEAGLGLQRGAGRSYQIFFARTVAGRNTGHKTVVGVAASFGFRAPWRR